ncbi:UPF0149 family protein [Sphingobium sp. GW456-12-10-14-TSB1]|uniref:UPF0149 family protein n=1 Tax=Sphingobium sp. GW456-12-10-14-TSB1 TaxID=1987165 RepID=UPI0020CE43EB|nr:UPF0149 family protein [Sphingobium sp. GW456-12-10-14-TSB1]
MSFKRQTASGRTFSLEQLEIWLDTLDPPVAGVSSIDGFLAALAAGPSIINPDIWLKSILREHVQSARSGARTPNDPQALQPDLHRACRVP